MKQRTVSSNLELSQALEYLRAFREEGETPKSLADVAAILRNSNEKPLLLVDKSGVHRWLNYQPDDVVDAKTASRILCASRYLRATKDKPIELRFALIRGTCEGLPLLRLTEPKWSKQEMVTITPKYVETIDEGLRMLRQGDAEVALGPRDNDDVLNDTTVKRFFKITTVNIEALFPFACESPKRFAKAIMDRAPTEMKIGCLRNASYEDALEKLLEKNRVKTQPPLTEAVHNYADTAEKLNNRELHAVIGHPLFIANCKEKIRPELGLHHISAGVFGQVKMDVFVNIKISPFAACKCLHLICDSVAEINKNSIDPSFTFLDEVNSILSLHKAPKSAADVLQMFDYEVKTFETSTLTALWKPERIRALSAVQRPVND